jgi:hypothetical protein
VLLRSGVYQFPFPMHLRPGAYATLRGGAPLHVGVIVNPPARILPRSCNCVAPVAVVGGDLFLGLLVARSWFRKSYHKQKAPYNKYGAVNGA